MVGIRGGLYGKDSTTTWNIDSVLEASEDSVGLFFKYASVFIFGDGNPTAEQLESAKQWVHKIGALIEKRLNSHGQKYIAGDKVTVADCKVSAAFFTGVYNDVMPMPAVDREALKAVLAEYPKAQQYVETTMATLLKTYLENRPARPF